MSEVTADPRLSEQTLELQSSVATQLGLSLLELGRHNEAALSFARCKELFVRAQIAPSTRVAGCLLGNARSHLAAGKSGQAIDELQPLLRAWEATNPGSPWHGESLYWLSIAQVQSGKAKLARESSLAARTMLAGAKSRALQRLSTLSYNARKP
jgi:hypothetical protein